MAPPNMPAPSPLGNGGRIALVSHTLDGERIDVRQIDGYINATAMCKVAGKQFHDYVRTGPTRAFVSELESETGIPFSELIQSVKGGSPEAQGTWVHPQVAIHLAQWLSPRFAVRVSNWVYEWLSGEARRDAKRVPYHLRRYVANQPNVPDGHFSVLTEMVFSLIAPLDLAGYELPESLWPDISEGILFAKYLREERDYDTKSTPTYLHVFEDGRRPVRAKAYPNELLPVFRGHFTTVWLRQRARTYFLERDPDALAYVDAALPASRPRGMLPLSYPPLPERSLN